MRERMPIIRRLHLLLLVGLSLWALIGVAWLATPSRAEEQIPPPGAVEGVVVPLAAERVLPSQGSGFVYIREGRPDPFFPFLSQEIAKAEEKARSEAVGTGRYDPGQLTLVAIVFAGSRPLAMVQNAAGEGFTVRKGDAIGQGGTVVDIVPGKVIVSQKIDTVSGSQKKTRMLELVLNTEGEKK